MSPKPTYTFKKPIANHIKKCIEGGVSVKDMLMSLGKLRMETSSHKSLC